MIGEGEVLAELQDGEVIVDRHRVVARVLVDRLDTHPPRSVVLLVRGTIRSWTHFLMACLTLLCLASA